MARISFTLVGDSDEQNIVVFVPGESPLVAHSSHPNFAAIVQGARDGDENIVALFDIAEALEQKFQSLSERVSTAGGKLFLDGDELNGVIVDHVLRAMEDGLIDFQPLVNFIENLADNPQPGSVEQLYAWLKRENFTIDTDGMIVAYKGVAPDGNGGFRSIKSGRAVVNGQEVSGTIPQNIGDVVTMPRSAVEYDPQVACATGLHVGNFDYASGWAQGAVLEVRVNPRDVVSVPTDCEAQKVRVCRYTVVDVTERKYDASVIGTDLAAPVFFDVWGDGEGDDIEPDDDPFGPIW